MAGREETIKAVADELAKLISVGTLTISDARVQGSGSKITHSWFEGQIQREIKIGIPIQGINKTGDFL